MAARLGRMATWWGVCSPNLDFGFSKPSTRLGMKLLAGIALGSCFATDEQKRRLIEKNIQFYRFCGVKPDCISDQELQRRVWMCWRSVFNVLLASPLFYASYHGIHRSGLPLQQHFLQSCGRGISGTLAALPPLIVYYGASTLEIPIIQSRLVDHGYSKANARDTAKRVAFVGLGAPVEFTVEAWGCGMRFNQLRLVTALFGTVCIAGRLATGVLVQYRAAERRQTGCPQVGPSGASDVFFKTLIGTTLAQHGINASMQTMANGKGIKGVWHYFISGQVSGKAELKGSLRQLGGTFLQRILFSALWTALCHREQPLPKWMRC